MPPYGSGPPDLTDTGSRRHAWGSAAVLLAALIVGQLPGGAQQAVASALRDSLLRPFLALQESIVRARLRSVDVGVLRARMDSLVVELTSYTTLAEENDGLRGLLGLSARLGSEYRSATVARPGTAGSESVFLLDQGANDGVRARAPVVTREGLAGVVRETTARGAVGMDWTHPEFGASAMTVDGLTFGIVESRHGDFGGGERLLLTGTPFSTSLEAGTVVVTSGQGGVFPRGVPIGRIRELAASEGGWWKSYWIDAFVEVGSLTHVLVALGEAPSRESDLGSAWDAAVLGTRGEWLAAERARSDSLATLRDSIVRLEGLVEAARRAAADTGSTGGGP